jgi:hypothetical protein
MFGYLNELNLSLQSIDKNFLTHMAFMRRKDVWIWQQIIIDIFPEFVSLEDKADEMKANIKKAIISNLDSLDGTYIHILLLC